MKLFLDDFRAVTDCFNYMGKDAYLYAGFDWHIVRSYDEFVKYISENEMPELISFDHDLADEHYQDLMKDANWNKPDNNIELAYGQYKEKTGYECAKWLIEYCLVSRQPLPQTIVHSMNPIGKKNILGLINNFRKNNQ